MAAPILLRSGIGADGLRRAARRSLAAGQARRLPVLAAISDGGWRGGAARVGGASRQTVRCGGSGHGPVDSIPANE